MATNDPRSNDPRSLDPTNVIRPLLLVVRPEADGTLTLLLDVPQSDALPLELGGGFRSFDQVLQVVMQSLTAPAVAEERVAGIEEALPTVNQLVDSVNAMQDEIDRLKSQVAELLPDLRPMRIPRLGELRRPPQQPTPGSRRASTQYEQMRNVWDDQFALPQHTQTSEPLTTAPRMPQRPTQPPQEPRSAGQRQPEPGEKRDLTVREGARPTFDRGSFEPHQPVGRVARGPGTPD